MLLHLTEQRQFVVMIEEHLPHNLGQDGLGRTGNAGIIEEMAWLILGLSEQIVGQPSHHGILVEAAFGLQQFHSMQQTAKLVLPSASGRQHLFEHQCAVPYLVFIPPEPTEVVQRAQHGRRQQAAGSQSAARRDGREQRNLYSTAKVGQLVLQRVGGRGMETGQREGSLWNGEGTSHLLVVGQFVVGAYLFHRPQVDASQGDEMLPAGLYVGLERWLTVQFDGQVDHIATLHQAERRCVGPAS